MFSMPAFNAITITCFCHKLLHVKIITCGGVKGDGPNAENPDRGRFRKYNRFIELYKIKGAWKELNSELQKKKNLTTTWKNQRKEYREETNKNTD